MPADLASLLQALEGAEPCGADMSFSNEFDALRELRRADDPTLDQGAWVTERKRSDWPGVLAACEQLLSQRTKDLRVAGWWAEAAGKLRGYDGLADGLELYTGLIRNFWDGVHPLPDGGDQELRIGAIVWLLSLLQEECRRVPVLKEGENRYSLADLELARQRQQAGAEPTPGQVVYEDVLRAQRKTPVADVAAALEAARRLPQALADLQTEVDARLAADGPGFAAAREKVADSVTALERLLREMGGGDSPAPAASAPAGASTSAGPASPSWNGGAPTNRAQALAQLRQVADFFRRTEPHSPVAYLAERAASWGEMPLHRWLRAVMKDSASLSQLEELLGVPPAPSEDGSGE